MRWRRWIGSLLALLMLLGTATPALAKGNGKSPFGLPPGQAKKAFVLQLFYDLQDYGWAEAGIARMAALGLMKGNGQGQFQPNRPITRAEAVTVAVRLMGLEDEAVARRGESQAALKGEFSDYRAVPDWAVPYLLEALDQDVIPAAEDGQLRPNEAASRLWTAVLLVRALGLEDEAERAMDDSLSFKDAAQVPDKLVGYVAVAVEEGLIRGYEDGTFRPNRPVTRAEMAVLLARTDERLGEGWPRQGQIRGTLTEVDEDWERITVEAKSGTLTLEVAEDAAIYLNGRRAELEDLAQGMRVSIALGSDAEVLFLEAFAEGDVAEDELEGTITDLTNATSTRRATLTLKDERGKKYELTVSRSVEVEDEDGDEIEFSDLEVGDEVWVQIENDLVIRVEVRNHGDNYTRKETGVILDLDEGSSSAADQVTLLLYASHKFGDRVKYDLDEDAALEKDGRTISFDDLEVGNWVEVRVKGDVVTQLEVLDYSNDKWTVEGYLTAVRGATSRELARVTVDQIKDGRRTGARLTYWLSPAVEIVGDEDEDDGHDDLALGDLQLGSRLKLTLQGGIVTRIEVRDQG